MILQPKSTEAQHILGECMVRFEHIKRSYALEEHKSLKMAFTLNF